MQRMKKVDDSEESDAEFATAGSPNSQQGKGTADKVRMCPHFLWMCNPYCFVGDLLSKYFMEPFAK
jgi:hypothetical protein